MKKEEIINEMLEAVEAPIRAAIFQLRMSKNSLIACNFIVQVGAMTVKTSEEKTVAFETSNYPTQYDQDGVNQILKGTYYNGNNEVIEPKVYLYKDWYKEQIRKALKARFNLRKALLAN